MKHLCAEMGEASRDVVGEGLSGEVTWAEFRWWRGARCGGRAGRWQPVCRAWGEASSHRIYDFIPSATGSRWYCGVNQLILCAVLKNLFGHCEGQSGDRDGLAYSSLPCKSALASTPRHPCESLALGTMPLCVPMVPSSGREVCDGWCDMSTWLGYGPPRQLVNLISGCVCQGVSGRD